MPRYFIRLQQTGLDDFKKVYNIEIERSKPIRGIEDINKLEEYIARDLRTKKQSFKVDILSWQRFEEEVIPCS